ncbi:MAG TPA: hypothetical protein VFZ34_33480 [Blastocatellia bacterium]|nr:hypothetical protein [Blastocatellia bacterium]
MNTNYKPIMMLALLGLGLLAGCQTQAAKKALAERNENNAKRFAARAEFTRKPAKVALVKTPFIKGQTVEMAALNGGEYNFKMIPVFPSDGNPDEIKTIIQQDCRPIQKGVYRLKDDPTKTLPAMAMVCQVTLIDRATATAYYVKNFETEPDPEAVTSKDAKSVYKTPDKEIKAFLESLPRQ